MKHSVLKVHQEDNVMVALENLKAGTVLQLDSGAVILRDDIPAKQKFFLQDMQAGDEVIMYGVLVGKVVGNIQCGGLMTTENVKHAAGNYTVKDSRKIGWNRRDTALIKSRRLFSVLCFHLQ